MLMYVDSQAAKFVLKIKPEWERFKTEKGGIIVKVKKALYGFKQSGLLWNRKVSRDLEGLGFVYNPEEPCIFNGTVDGHKVVLIVYVDDIAILSTSVDARKKVSEQVTTLYGIVTINEGVKHDYLGMIIDFSQAGQARITMPGLVDKLLINVEGTAPTPAAAGARCPARRRADEPSESNFPDHVQLSKKYIFIEGHGTQ